MSKWLRLRFSIKWMHLGHATSAEIEALANTVVPTDIMDVKYTDPNDTSYKKIGYDGASNWVKLAPNSKLPTTNSPKRLHF